MSLLNSEDVSAALELPGREAMYVTTSVCPYLIEGSEVVEEVGEKRMALADFVEPKAVSGEDIIHEPFVPKGIVASTEVKS